MQNYTCRKLSNVQVKKITFAHLLSKADRNTMHTNTHTHTHTHIYIYISLSHRHIHTGPHKLHRQGGLALEKSVTRQLLIANSRERSRCIPCKVGGGRSGKRKVSFRQLRLSLLSKTPPKLHIHLHLSIFLPEGQVVEA